MLCGGTKEGTGADAGSRNPTKKSWEWENDMPVMVVSDIFLKFSPLLWGNDLI